MPWMISQPVIIGAFDCCHFSLLQYGEFLIGALSRTHSKWGHLSEQFARLITTSLVTIIGNQLIIGHDFIRIISRDIQTFSVIGWHRMMHGESNGDFAHRHWFAMAQPQGTWLNSLQQWSLCERRSWSVVRVGACGCTGDGCTLCARPGWLRPKTLWVVILNHCCDSPLTQTN